MRAQFGHADLRDGIDQARRGQMQRRRREPVERGCRGARVTVHVVQFGRAQEISGALVLACRMQQMIDEFRSIPRAQRVQQ